MLCEWTVELTKYKSPFVQAVAQYTLLGSDSIIEYRVLDTRTFQLYFEYSNFRVIDSSSRVSFFQIDSNYK
jgi:hypothetical protein